MRRATTVDIRILKEKALWVRREALEMAVHAGKGHLGGAFSCVDIIVTLYYGGFLNIDPKEPRHSNRDRFILSKGHAALALYPVLADVGYFSKDKLATFCRAGSFLKGHPDRGVPGVEADTGSLGHGLGIGAGMALHGTLEKLDYTVYVLMGDGECYEGSVWEAAMFAGHHKLHNLVAIIDRNERCATDRIEACVRLEDFAAKWAAFGWDTCSIDGHSFDEIVPALSKARERSAGRPLAIIARTVKGKGVSFMEGVTAWHHGVPSGDQLARARSELSRGVIG